MFNKNITIIIWKENKDGVLKIVEKYTNGTIYISDEGYNTTKIKFRVSKFKTKKVTKLLNEQFELIRLYVK